jgi:general secretion pathway protein B
MYYELPFNVRKDLPTLAVSMHVYAAVPEQRFVVIDGERKSEGEVVREGLTLREIRSDGIVLDLRGQRFFYPRPGR